MRTQTPRQALVFTVGPLTSILFHHREDRFVRLPHTSLCETPGYASVAPPLHQLIQSPTTIIPQSFCMEVQYEGTIDIAKGALNWIGIGAVGGEVEQFEAGVSSQPLLDFLGLMQLGIVGDHGELGTEGRGVGPVKRSEQLQEEPRLFPIPHTMRDLSGRDI
jgi:hypothetical protein